MKSVRASFVIRRTVQELKRAFRRFSRERKGAVALLLGVGMLPAVSLGTGSVLLGRELHNMDPMQLVTDSTAVALAKIKSTGSDAMLNNATALAWAKENARTLENSLTLGNVTLEVTDSSLYVSTDYRSKPRMTGDIARIFDRNSASAQKARSEFYASPLEVVFTIDQSGMSDGGQEVASGMSKVLDKLFDGKSSNDMIKVSVVAVGVNVNIRKKHADLVSKASRRLQGPDDPYYEGTEAAYELRKKVLEEINPSLVEDLLQPGGPGYEADLVMVARPDLQSEKDMDDFLSKLDTAPSSEEDKFVLLVNDGRTVSEGYAGTYNLDSYATGLYGMSNMTAWPLSAKRYDGKEVICAPESFWEDEYNASLRMGGFIAYDNNSWVSLKKAPAGDLLNGIVSYPMCGPVMPILANSSSVSEILDHVALSMPGMMGCVDEHFTWAYRLLSPGWSGVWSNDGTYPAPYTSSTVKHAWINVGRDTGGGYTSGLSGSDIDILPDIMRKFAENKIIVHFLLDYPADNIQREIEDAAEEYGNALGWEVIDLSSEPGDLYDIITQHLERPANFIRLAPVVSTGA